MSLKCGIVGLPNVGKSTLFNALTKAGIAAENYPFCTIEPNTGVVEVPDPRLQQLSEIVEPERIVPAIVEFVDIAGLVAGASTGEGLGNKFLAHIRETDAIVNVVRCFEDDNVIHVANKVDPIADIEVIQTELCLADLAAVEKAIHRVSKIARSGDKDAVKQMAILEKCQAALNDTQPVRTIDFSKEERAELKQFFFITAKPAMFVANVSEDGFENNPFLDRLKAFAAKQNAPVVAICAKIEAELSEMDDADRLEFLKELGQDEPGLNRLIRSAYTLLGLQTYFTAGVKEVRAWTIHVADNPQAQGALRGMGAVSGGLIAATGIIGPVIPPSIGLVIFGVAANVSISKLFLAAIVPGLLIGGALWITWAWLVRHEKIEPPPRQSGRQIASAAREAGWALMLPVIILVGLRMGVFTPTEAAVVAAVYALFVATVIYRELRFPDLYKIFVSAAKTSAVVMFLIAAAMVSAWLITVADLPAKVVALLEPFMGNKILLMIAIMLLVMAVGTAMDMTPTILILTPVLMPVVAAAGIVCINVDVFMHAGAADNPGHTVLQTLLGVLCATGALLCWSWYTLDNARYLKRNPHFTSAEWSALYGLSSGLIALLIGAVALAVWHGDVLGAAGKASGRDWTMFWITNSLLALGASVIGNHLWNVASRRVPVTLSGQLILFETLFALLNGRVRWKRAPSCCWRRV
eukprot:gene17472-19909_t